MKLTEIKTLIDKVIGKRGPIRTPAWWVRKIFYELIDWVTSSLTQNKKEVQKEVDQSLEKSLPYISVYGGSSRSSVVIEGKTYIIDPYTRVKIPYRETFKPTKGRFAGINHIDFRGASKCPKDLSYLFHGADCFNIDLSPLDTSEVTDMSYMFSSYYNYQFVKLGNLNMSNVRDMSYMFRGAKFQQIDMMGDNIAAGLWEKAVGMFENCSASHIWFNFNSTGADGIDYTGLFRNCGSLRSLNVGRAYDYSNITFANKTVSLKEAFKGCSKLTKLRVDGPSDIQSEDGLESMFEGCSGLTTLWCYYFNTKNQTSMRNIFKGCSALETLVLSKNFFRLAPEEDIEVDFSDLKKWTGYSVKQSLVTDLYTRTSSDLAKGSITIRLSQETFDYLTEDQRNTIIGKGYNLMYL